jgi:hypothetical protein
MPHQATTGSATRRSSADSTERPLERPAATDNRAQRDRVLASLLACPGARTSGRRNGVTT